MLSRPTAYSRLARVDDVVPGAQFHQIAARGEPFERALEPAFALTFGAKLALELFELGPRVRQVFDVLQ